MKDSHKDAYCITEEENLNYMFKGFMPTTNSIGVESRKGKKYIVLVVEKCFLEDSPYCFSYNAKKKEMIIFPCDRQPENVKATAFDSVENNYDKGKVALLIDYKKAPKKLVSSVRFLRKEPSKLRMGHCKNGILVIKIWVTNSTPYS